MTKEELFNKNINIAYKITQHYRLFSSIIYDNITLENVLEDTENEMERIEKSIDNENYIAKIRNSNLKEREKQILELLLQNYKQQQIAKIVGCSQPQISRIIKKFRRKL